MKSIEESVVIALDGDGSELFPYLPYILQDIWEIGTDPDTVINLIGKYFEKPEALKVLDLGCGKGAVLIKVAYRFKCHCHGIDALEDFIQFAKDKAKEYMVEKYCNFEVGDIREVIHHLPEYDVIILGAIGPVFGNYEETLKALKKCLKENGAFIIDDAYIENSSDFAHPLILKKAELEKQVDSVAMYIAEILPVSKDEVLESDEVIINNLKKRCYELAEKHPEKKQLFMDYVRKQEYEGDVNASKAICATMVIKKK